jgi:O-antigen ligase
MVKQVVVKKASKDFSEAKWIFALAVLITIFINPKLTDPFNAPKMYLLMICCVVISNFLLFHKKKTTDLKSNNYLSFILLVFGTILIFQVLLTDLKYAAIFGDSLRQLGSITYFSFAVFMLAAEKFFRFEARLHLYNSVLLLSVFYVFYGILQYTGNDPFNWVNQYNPIIGTLGNPNFSSALMAVLSTLCFGFFFDNSLQVAKRSVFLIVSLLLAVVIYLTDARQGLLSLIAGIGLISTVKLFKFKPRLGMIGFGILLIGAFLALAGILQSGPLERFLYKPSVTLRGYYWGAGLDMLQNNFLTGVGIERYGVHFRQSVDPEFPVKFGYDLMTNNAHNVPIQFFATGGVLLGSAYIAILCLVMFYGLRGIFKLSGKSLNLHIAIFSAWVAYQLQSFVSIDNIGLSIWGWVLGGAIVGLVNSSLVNKNDLLDKNSPVLTRQKSDASYQVLVTGISLIFCLILVLRLTQSESIMFKSKNQFNQVSAQGQGTLRADLNAVIGDPLAQPYYKIEAADMFFMLGDIRSAIEAAENVVRQDPINPTYIGVLATMYERSNRYSEAINQRLILSKYDPNNAKNYFQLLKLYKTVGNATDAAQMLNKITSLAPNSDLAMSSKKELE